MRKALFATILLAACLALASGAAHAQSGYYPTPCQGGTGSTLTSVAISATTVCSASGQNTRRYWRVVANSGTYGAIALACTDDGTTPTSSHYSFVVFGQLATDSSGPPVVSQSAIQCLSLTGSAVTISAAAVQVEQP